jgi:hypothetical protein
MFLMKTGGDCLPMNSEPLFNTTAKDLCYKVWPI